MMNDFDTNDTPMERELRRVTANLRSALRELISDAEYALNRMDEGQRPTASLYPGRVVDASKVNGYGAQFEALLNFPWGTVIRVGDADRADEIVRTAGKQS